MQDLIWFQRDRNRHTDRGLDISEEFVTFNRVTKSSRWCVWTNYPVTNGLIIYRGVITNSQQKMKTKNNAILRDRSREEEEFNRGHLVYRI